ncbi:MAG: MBL fold metallo-hydrolase [Desulfobacterium sp.]|nr:MBL fold metallo-hydrolase [Desulfobacterium sp.]MBU3948301.1 MBL fold metallo-hydrolase [Pseudomonadota bacterium]MBU4037165.1 MBL fold metallo-hydrolase [Pseudomonadota bacterium]
MNKIDDIYVDRLYPYLAMFRIPYFSSGNEKAFANVFLVIDDELMLIDAGPYSEDKSSKLTYALKQSGFDIKDISRIVYTHSHPDHMGGGLGLDGYKGIRHCIYREAKNKVEKYGEYVSSVKSIAKNIFSELLFLYPEAKDTYFDVVDHFWNPTYGEIGIDEQLDEGDSISTGKLKFKVIFTPGHSPWDITLLEETKSLLFSGDFLLSKSSTMTGGLNGFGSDLISYESSLKKINKYLDQIKCIYPAHGPAITSFSNLTDSLLAIVKGREDKIFNAISTNNCSLMDLMKVVYPSIDSVIVLARCLGIVLTHLEKLENESKIHRIKDSDEVRFCLGR